MSTGCFSCGVLPMADISCPVCNGAGMTFNTGKPRTCPNCKGKGKVPAPEKKQVKIMFIGEAYGEEEARTGIPFSGYSGKELFSLMEDVGISAEDCYFTSVFKFKPEGKSGTDSLGTAKALSHVPMPPMGHNLYLQDQYFIHLEKLWKEIEEQNPVLIVALGNIALWAVTGNYGIRALRGTVCESCFGPEGIKVLPTYSPGTFLKDWSLRPVVTADLMKAVRQSAFREIHRPSRKIWLEPSLRDIEYFYDTYIKPAKVESFDIETDRGQQITCVGFAPSRDLAIVIPFVDWRKKDGSYWPTPYQEKLAWQWVGKYLAHVDNPETELLGQNTLYDINWLWSKIGVTPKNYCRDTMLKHHALNPEFDKGLGFLGSIYTEEPAWKTMRAKTTSNKRGE